MFVYNLIHVSFIIIMLIIIMFIHTETIHNNQLIMLGREFFQCLIQKY